MEKKQPFRALSKICLNNWHYIDKKVLTLNEGINFFTGHSGSGKSTVIDAIQLVLYANTDGRGFFNKAAADDSDRTLIEYLRGMVNISENNESQYLRNKNFSTTIVLELTQTDTKEKQCVGVVFDVETATNEINRMFFWHKGGLLENQYRADKRCLSTVEIREFLQRSFGADGYYCGPSNERFRRQLYDIYLGGLDIEKFPRLFKRAIPFRMNIKLEEFVKEYICMEQDIHIEDLQESVMQYGRMQNKIEETLKEIEYLREIQNTFGIYEDKTKEHLLCEYQIKRLEILCIEEKIKECYAHIHTGEEALAQLQTRKANLEEEQKKLQESYETLLIRINDSGYHILEAELKGINESIEHLNQSKARWIKTARALSEWKEKEVASNQMIWDIEKFEQGSIKADEIQRLKDSIRTLRSDLEEERRESDRELQKIKKEEKEARDELKELRAGKKAYPKALEEAKVYIQNQLYQTCKEFVSVHILADLLDVKDPTWHNAVEGYMGNNKLLLVVEPKYAKTAMEIYQQMDKKKYYQVAVLDTEKLMKEEFAIREGSLAEEVKAKEAYVQSYIRFSLGNVIKCRSIEELREQRIGITPECILYHSFRLQHINPESYTRRAYIGEQSVRSRIRQLEQLCNMLQEKRMPLQEEVAELNKLLDLEQLTLPADDYEKWISDADKMRLKEKQKESVLEKMQRLKEETLEALEKELEKARGSLDQKKNQIHEVQAEIWSRESECKDWKRQIVDQEEILMNCRRQFKEEEELEAVFQEYLSQKNSKSFESLRTMRQKACELLYREKEQSYQQLMDVRNEYLKTYPNRTFSISIQDNAPYDTLLEKLSCDHLEEYQAAASEQARSAVEHFKDDFIFKVRSAIREAYQRKDELNRIISRLDFGKDKYQFVITKNKGADGKYYKMFMDEALQIEPTSLSNHMENQMNMFTMGHEEEYGDLMNELIQIFIPPEHATKEELEEARKNMEKYADYRTYLSFDMQQIISGDKSMTIGLGKMIKKNSGGEGQNPLYVALLASFAQLYRINLSPKVRRPATIRLVVLDEAFSKMDAEKVASCIALIRGLGFQAIISATNDKIQNYLENVDKTFVYANPDKRHISIQEFEKKEFAELIEAEDD